MQVLYLFKDIALLNVSSSSEETCVRANGQNICYFKAWDFISDWDTAWQLCNSRNSTLPVIHNRNEQDAFEKILNFYNMVGSIGWTSGKIHRYDGWTWLDGRQISGEGKTVFLHWFFLRVKTLTTIFISSCALDSKFTQRYRIHCPK